MRFLCYLSLAQAFHLAEQQSLIALCSLVEKDGFKESMIQYHSIKEIISLTIFCVALSVHAFVF